MPLAVKTIPSFDRVLNKLHAKDKKVVDEAVRAVATGPSIREEKRGDLVGVFVHKFKLNSYETQLAYLLQPDKRKPETCVLLAVGQRENFYTPLKGAK